MKKQDKRRGSLTVETLLFLIPFMLAFLTIINMARFIQAEMIIHHAITQTAKEISVYGHVMTKTGITEKMQDRNKRAEKFKRDVDDTVKSVEEYLDAFSSGDVGEIYKKEENAANKVEAFVSNPSAIAQGVFDLAKSDFNQRMVAQVTGNLAKASIKKQLSLMTNNPDQYLKNIGVVGGLDGLNFSKSNCNSNNSGNGNIDIVVTFTIKNQMFPQFDFGEHEYMLSVSTLMW